MELIAGASDQAAWCFLCFLLFFAIFCVFFFFWGGARLVALPILGDDRYRLGLAPLRHLLHSSSAVPALCFAPAKGKKRRTDVKMAVLSCRLSLRANTTNL